MAQQMHFIWVLAIKKNLMTLTNHVLRKIPNPDRCPRQLSKQASMNSYALSVYILVNVNTNIYKKNINISFTGFTEK